ncbi:hypothetical protein OROMI_001916 [Orobanche minor]
MARNLFIKIRPSQEILKIRDGTSLETEEILTYIKKPSKQIEEKSGADFVFKIWPSQEILKIRHGTPLETEEILTYIKSPQNRSFWHFYSNLDVPSNVVQKKKRVARILFFKIRPSQEILKIRDVARNLFIKIRPSQEILKIRDGTSLETEEILTYIKKPSKQIVQKKRVLQILFFKIRPSQEILKIRDDTPLETEEILTYIKSPQNRSVWHFSSNLDVPSNVVQNKRVARILFFKIRPSQEILKIRDDVPSNVVHKKRVARNLFIKIRPSQEILKIRDGTSLETEEILTYIKKPSKQIEILKIRDGTPMEAEEILIYIKSPQNRSVWHFSSNLDVPSNVVQKKRVARILNLDVPINVVQKKRVARILFFKIRPSQEIQKIRDVLQILFFKIRPSQEILKIRDDTPLETDLKIRDVLQILFFKIRPSQEILKIRDDTPLETEEILTYIKSPQNRSVWHFSSNLDVPSNVVQKKRVARILFFKIRPSQEILKIRDDVPSNVVHKKRVARNLFIKIRPSQEILKIRDGTSLETEEILTYIKKPSKQIVARILFFKIRPSQEILKIRDGTPMEAEEILTYIKSPQNRSVWHFSSNLDVPSNVVQKKRVARILFFKIRPSQEILKISHGTPLETEEILTYIKSPYNVVHKKRVARNLFIKIRPSQEILKIRDGTSLETEEILTYIKKPSKQIDVPINVVQKKRVLQILFFKITPSQEILKIRDGTPLETEEILTYIKNPQNRSVWHFSSNLDVPINVVQKKRVARILFFKIRPSQEILKIRHGTPLETEEILTYIKSPQNRSFWHFYSNLDVPSNVVQKKRVARILFFKIRPSQEILKIRYGTPMEAEEILIYIKKPS